MEREERDTSVMFEYLEGLPEQLAQALQWDYDFALRLPTGLQSVLVAGMGGSAIGGDILRTYAASRLALPVFVVRDYILPRYADRNTLLFAISYSGNTEETLAVYQQAREQGLAVVAVTSGGLLRKKAEEDGVPLILVPGNLVPRAAIGYLFAPLVLTLEKMGLLTGVSAELAETIEVLGYLRAQMGRGEGEEKNIPRRLADAMYQAFPVIWGASGTSEVAALRMKTQLNENAKVAAYANLFPELNHNETVGLEEPEALLENTVIILLRHPEDHPRVRMRMDLTQELIKDRVKEVIEVTTSGNGWLSRLFSLIYIGDYASVYLAQMYGINPLPVKIIDNLKGKLAKS